MATEVHKNTLKMQPIQSRFDQIRQNIEQFTMLYQRPAGSVTLIAVSKVHGVEKVIELATLGQRDFAENYLQEGVDKIERTAEIFSSDTACNALCWHFIGHIQSRKCRMIAQYFSWVHTVDSIKVANKLSQNRTADNPLNVLIQLNLQQEESKSGVPEEALWPLAREIAGLPNLILRGLMILPKAEKDFEKQRIVFRQCRKLLDDMNSQGFNLDHLSMGMTDDMEAAIAEGATMVRIGTAIFGPRPEK